MLQSPRKNVIGGGRKGSSSPLVIGTQHKPTASYKGRMCNIQGVLFHLFISFQTIGMIKEAKARYVQAGGKLDPKQGWTEWDALHELDDVHDSDDEDEIQETRV